MTQDALRSTVADVDLDAIAANVRALGDRAGAHVIAVVKADAYGHGAEAVAAACLDAGAVMLAVATVEEAVALRGAGIGGPILVLSGATVPGEVARAVAADLVLTVWDEQRARAVSEAATALRRTARVHFKVDTGLTRLGAPVGEAPDRYRRIRALPGIEVDGIFTHFARADESDRTTDRQQMASFLQVIGAIGELPRLVHAAASGGVAGIGRVPQMTAIRPGLSVYGVHASTEQASALALRPALTWRSQVLRLARVPKGTGVSYGHEYRLPRDGLIATVPVGYGDGLARSAAKRGGLLVRGRRVTFAGRIAMDLVMLDVTAVAGVREGDEAVIIGEQDGARQSADDLAAACGTISYEVLTAIRRRVPRRYFRGGRLVATRTLAEGYRER